VSQALPEAADHTIVAAPLPHIAVAPARDRPEVPVLAAGVHTLVADHLHPDHHLHQVAEDLLQEAGDNIYSTQSAALNSY
jgi:hypothetical protein